VANAVADAIGKRVTHLPVTAERIFFALHGEALHGEAHHGEAPHGRGAPEP
jgi:hypothetical protein